MFYYKIYGWRLQSDFELKQVPVWKRDENAVPDLIIEKGEIGAEFVGRAECFSDIHEGRTLFSNNMIHMVIENGRKITYELLNNANLQSVNAYFIGWGMAIAAFQKGQTAVHCSALVNENGAVLISGESGSGKSTLCTHFLEKGFSFMADDIAVVDVKDDKAVVYPTFPYQKLCRNVVDEKQLDYKDLIYINEDKDKFLVPVKKFNDSPAPVNCLIFLSVGPTEEVTCKELKGVEKFLMCNKAVFFNRLFRNKNMPPKAGALCLDLASTIKVYAISRPEGKDTQEEICKLAEKLV